MHTLPLLSQQFAELSPFFYSHVSPEPLTAPYWVAFNTDLAAELNLNTDFQTTANLAYLSGNAPQYAPAPIASVYSGHQFGVYTPRLGDGHLRRRGQAQAGGRIQSVGRAVEVGVRQVGVEHVLVAAGAIGATIFAERFEAVPVAQASIIQ